MSAANATAVQTITASAPVQVSTGNPTSPNISLATVPVSLLPYKGDKIALYDGTRWMLYSVHSSGLSFSPTWPANSSQDIYLDWKARSPVLGSNYECQWT
jgi:hypothetical protein